MNTMDLKSQLQHADTIIASQKDRIAALENDIDLAKRAMDSMKTMADNREEFNRDKIAALERELAIMDANLLKRTEECGDLTTKLEKATEGLRKLSKGNRAPGVLAIARETLREIGDETIKNSERVNGESNEIGASDE